MALTQPDRLVRGACQLDCPDTCSWIVTVKGGQAVSPRGDTAHPYTRGALCNKVDNYLAYTRSANRLLHPMRRSGPKGRGEFLGVSWDEAIDYTQIHADNVGGAAANMFWVVRTTADPMTIAAPFTQELRRIDPEVAPAQMRPLDNYLAQSLAPRRFSLLLLSIFGAAALGLAVTGIYAVISYGASQRTREIAIRMALGARQVDIQRLVVRQGMASTVVGVALGLPLALGASRVLSTMLFELSPTDTSTFIEVIVTIVAVAAIACAVPAARAARAGTAALTQE